MELPRIGEDHEHGVVKSNNDVQIKNNYYDNIKLNHRQRLYSAGYIHEKQERKRSRTYTLGSMDCTKMYTKNQSSVHSSNDTLSVGNDKFGKLKNLKALYEQGFITEMEFQDRKFQLIDDLTGTKSRSKGSMQYDGSKYPRPMLPIVYHPPPCFDHVLDERAVKYEFDYERRKWTTSKIKVKLDEAPFAKGGLRMVYHLWDASVSGETTFVAKLSIDPNEDDETYFKDVEMQAVAADYAKLYNSYHPPRNVEFVQAWLLQLTDRNDVICGVEKFIKGDYRKHNNNCGYVSDLERNTPQAFSHFTYEASNHEILVVDIQGVRDHYTDPQIHTRRGKEFGKGNLSMRGFEKFLSSHRCNAICMYLRLPLINPKDSQGTVPLQTYMSQPCIDPVKSELRHYYGNSNAYKQRLKQISSTNARLPQRVAVDLFQPTWCTSCNIL